MPQVHHHRLYLPDQQTCQVFSFREFVNTVICLAPHLKPGLCLTCINYSNTNYTVRL